MVIGGATALTVAAFLILPSIPTELVPQTDEGEVTVSARLASGTRVERTEQIAQRLEEMIDANVPEIDPTHDQLGRRWRRFMGGSASSVNVTVKLKPRAERTRTSDQIATALRRVIVGIPGTTISTRASGGNQQLTRALGGGNQDSRLAVEIRGEDLDESRRIGGDVVEAAEGRAGHRQSPDRPRRGPAGARDSRRSARRPPSSA